MGIEAAGFGGGAWDWRRKMTTGSSYSQYMDCGNHPQHGLPTEMANSRRLDGRLKWKELMVEVKLQQLASDNQVWRIVRADDPGEEALGYLLGVYRRLDGCEHK